MKEQLILLGPKGSFSDLASRKLEKKFKKRYVKSFAELFKLVKQNKSAGFVPVKNTIAGPISPCVNFFKKNKTQVFGHQKFSINLVLASRKDAPRNIKVIYCPEILYLQCRKFLKRNFPTTKVVKNIDSSSLAYKKIVQGRRLGAAAVGASLTAKSLNLRILKRNIQDYNRNSTQFVLFKMA